ncbi:hypothetical protein B0H17DRAFT_860166, partial [Mycena rosella]
CHGAVGNDPQYHCGDARLGPATLPSIVPLSSMIDEFYDRLGGLCPGAFLEKWWNESTGYYAYPPADGFQLSIVTTLTPALDGGNLTLEPGMRVDRFGSEEGRYLAPAYTPFAQRALPPWSLNDPEKGYPPSNYHLYQVERSFTVRSGTIAAWFGQSGQGAQYLATESISKLVDEGFLSRV